MTAEELSGQWIGRDIEFSWEFPTSYVKAVVTGELREVSHNGSGDVIVWLAGRESVGDKTEFVLQRGTRVVGA